MVAEKRGICCYFFTGSVCAVCTLCTFTTFLLSLDNRVAVYLEIAAHSANDMFSKYKYLIVNLVFSTSVFREGISF